MNISELEGMAPRHTLEPTSAMRTPGRASWFVVRHFALVVAAIALVMFAHAAIATGGTLRFDDEPEGHVQELAEAFLAGQLHLKNGPSPEMLALDDPYDVDKNFEIRRPDAVLFNGKYYWYWGPVPTLLHAGWMLLTGQSPPVSASFLVYVTGGALLFLVAAHWLRLSVFPTVSPWWTLIGFVAFALGGTNPLLLSRLIIHQEVIAAGGFFVLPGAASLIRAFMTAQHRLWLLCSLEHA